VRARSTSWQLQLGCGHCQVVMQPSKNFHSQSLSSCTESGWKKNCSFESLCAVTAVTVAAQLTMVAIWVLCKHHSPSETHSETSLSSLFSIRVWHNTIANLRGSIKEFDHGLFLGSS
jgi:hypothetical protein